jgi:hypothetical protein
MPSTEEQIQQTVASLDSGRLSAIIWRLVFALVALGLAAFYLISDFHGLPMSQSMDQAQIGREILRGHGWSTRFFRPLAIGELKEHGLDVSTGVRKDTYNAPVPPLLDAAAIAIPIRGHWDLFKGATVSAADRAIACMGVVFLLAALVVLYFIARELFDARLAAKAAGLALVCDMLWRYALSGLPQMFLLLMLHLNVYALLRAMRRTYLNQSCYGWLAAMGFGFGIMALTHALSIFIFVPVLLFSLVFFRPRGWAALLMLAVFLAVYAPWLVRNAMVCGDFRGIAGHSILDGIVHPEAGHMRRFAIDLGSTNGNYFAENFRLNLTQQINRLIEYLGWSCVAPLALVSVLHGFRRPITATFRWLMFAMWGSAVCGMALFGMKQERDLAANQFYLLFVPLFISYGLAYVLVQWDRRIGLGFILPGWGGARSRGHTLMRRLLFAVIVGLSALPLIGRLLLDRSPWLVEWPPYLAPSIASMQKLFLPNEIIASDMPWAVAWYADRDSLWLPYQPSDLIEISDYRRLGEPICGLYFTPISGSENTLSDLVSGEYSNWTAYIVHTVEPDKTPYPYRLRLGMPECVLYMDRNRINPPAAK